MFAVDEGGGDGGAGGGVRGEGGWWGWWARGGRGARGCGLHFTFTFLFPLGRCGGPGRGGLYGLPSLHRADPAGLHDGQGGGAGVRAVEVGVGRVAVLAWKDTRCCCFAGEFLLAVLVDAEKGCEEEEEGDEDGGEGDFAGVGAGEVGGC